MTQAPVLNAGTQPLADSGRRKKFATRSRAGCLTCRRRRVKCDEAHPSCRRCITAKFVCEYRQSPKGTPPSGPILLPQPSTSIRPENIPNVSYEINLFGKFRDTVVTSLGGPFNHLFWKVDVPIAAQVYPSLWHAAIAIAAIHHSAKIEKKRLQGSPDSPTSNYVPRNHHYLLALTHFNKSIRSLRDSLAGKSLDQLSYMDKEMVLMTNILFMGICAMLEDNIQLQTHYKSFTNLLSTMRFGDEHPAHRKGIMSFEDLLAVILAIDGSLEGSAVYETRWARPWVVNVPSYDTLESVTQAYIEFLPFTYNGLNKQTELANVAYDGPMRGTYRRNKMAAFEEKLTALVNGKNRLNSQDLEAIESMRLQLQVIKVKDEIFRKPNREAVMKYELGLFQILDHIDDLLTRTARVDGPYSDETAPITFSPSLGSPMEMLAAFPNNANLRRKAIELIRKWPFKENGSRSDEEAASYELILKHSLTGPERTKHWQKKGIPIHPTFPNGSLKEGEFDGLAGCECIYERYICRDHRIGRFTKEHAANPPRMGLMNFYERRNELGFTWYPLEY